MLVDPFSARNTIIFLLQAEDNIANKSILHRSLGLSNVTILANKAKTETTFRSGG